jgi:cobalamin biosynthesis Mg chelatase CobN
VTEDEHGTQDRRLTEEEARAAAEVRASALTLAASCLSVLAAKAWEAMGLVPSEATKQIERNLDEAQLAIDAAAALAEVLRPRVPETERREIENLIATLRLNYVEQKGKM